MGFLASECLYGSLDEHYGNGRIKIRLRRQSDIIYLPMPGIYCAFTAAYICAQEPKFACRNCGGGDRGRVAIYRPFGEFRRAKIALSLVWWSRPTTGVLLAHATMNFVGLDLTTSDRWHQKTTNNNKKTKHRNEI
ncbi:hypothetical protein TNCV_980921 [Trichonephila clavipes]|uniref:Uncharacterized protein n=1 Tax=Trichonephila clavipes TaxID=2585209 RepID=A0A8X6S572_TRICX|nr:hypothetical protein TNCV_980921 [Trichonephila clavipes]